MSVRLVKELVVIRRRPRFQHLPGFKVIRIGNPRDKRFHVSEIDIQMMARL